MTDWISHRISDKERLGDGPVQVVRRTNGNCYCIGIGGWRAGMAIEQFFNLSSSHAETRHLKFRKNVLLELLRLNFLTKLNR